MKNQEITQENLKKVEKILGEVRNMSSDDLCTFVEKLKLFHEYSVNNRMILMFEGAVNVKGYMQWKKLNRTVKKGAKAIWILEPKIRKIGLEKEKDEKTSEETIKKKVYGFKSVPVFDYRDTEGDELPLRALTTDSKIYLDELVGCAYQLSFPVDFIDLPYSVGGKLTCDGIIFLNAVHSEVENTGTLVHELAHALLGHHLEKESRMRSEQEAEILTYLICDRLGIERRSTFYLKAWLTDDQVLESFQKIDTAYKKFFEKMELC
jgi:hypothetical protein